MTYSVIENFAGGIDRTRARFAGDPGTLWDGVNGHITRGGDFEIRKEFVSKYTFPSGTFGLAATDSALYTFGSAPDPGVPSGVTYQRLQHPEGLDMSALLSWDLYDGKLYVAAQYSDGSIFHFYDGTRSSDFLEGRDRDSFTLLSDWLTELVKQINAGQSTVTASLGGTLNQRIDLTAVADNTPFSVSAIAKFADASTNSNWYYIYELQAAGVSQPQISVIDFGVPTFMAVGPSSGAGGRTLENIGYKDAQPWNERSWGNAALYDAAFSPTLQMWALVGDVSGGDADIWTGQHVTSLTERANASNLALYCAMWVPWLSMFIAAGEPTASRPYLLYSTDGVTWTAATAPTTSSLVGAKGVFHSEELGLAFIICNDEIMYSSLGSSGWSTSSTTWPFSTLDNVNAGCYGDNGAVVVGGDGTNAFSGHSDDGLVWTEHSTTLLGDFQDVTWCPQFNLYIAAGYKLAGGDSFICTSPDGKTWTRRTQPYDSDSTMALRIVVSDGVKCFVVGDDLSVGLTPQTVLSSSDGITWAEEENLTNGFVTSYDRGSIREDMKGPPTEVSITIGADQIGYAGMPPAGYPVRTHERKMYWADSSTLHFSSVDDATKVNANDDAGAGFINMGTHLSGASAIVGLGTYQDKFAVLSRRTIQLWNMESDDDNNTPFQYLSSIGTRAGKSVKQYGDLDLVFLAFQGIRSVRSRTGVNIAGVQDIGTPIDSLVREWVESVGSSVADGAISEVEPEDNRFWMAIGSRIFVFSYFPAKKISAWTYYDLAVTPEAFAVLDDRIYMRAGDVVYLYGGENNKTYYTGTVKLSLPFMAFKKDDTTKMLEGVDQATNGDWDVKVMINPNSTNEDEAVLLGTLSGVTWTKERHMSVGESTMFAPILTSQGGQYSSVSKVAVLYAMGDAKA